MSGLRVPHITWGSLVRVQPPQLRSAFIGRFFHITTADLGLEPITLDRWFESSVSGRQNAVSEQDLDKVLRICISVMVIIKTNKSELQV